MAEQIIQAALKARGATFETNLRLLEGTNRKVDIVFEGQRVAVFVDGCFWHGCPVHGTWPKRNADFWRGKIEANRARDADTDRRLRAEGWTVIRIWEHEDPDEAAAKILSAVCGTDLSRDTA